MYLTNRRYTFSGSYYHCYYSAPQLTSALTKNDKYGVLLTGIRRYEDRVIIDGFRSPLDSRSWSHLHSSSSISLLWSWVLYIRYQCLWGCFKSRITNYLLRVLTISDKVATQSLSITSPILIIDIALVSILGFWTFDFLKLFLCTRLYPPQEQGSLHPWSLLPPSTWYSALHMISAQYLFKEWMHVSTQNWNHSLF